MTATGGLKSSEDEAMNFSYSLASLHGKKCGDFKSQEEHPQYSSGLNLC